FTFRSQAGDKGNEVFLDGIRLGDRKRVPSNIGLDEMIVGGRFYSNDPTQPPFAQGFFHGDIASVLVYERALDDGEREKVEKALFDRAPALNAMASGSNGHALETLTTPPVVQMLVPGFTVQELPVKMKNLTGIRYRHDGKLVALGYDGRLFLLTDTDGDGLEDKAEIFWDKTPLRAPIGLALLPKNDPRGDGVLVANKSKISLLLDKDRDGQADEEMVVASGWKEIIHNVDALGVALDPRDGSVWFSLGCENFTDAYLHDPATGKSNYRLSSERGTIQRVAPDFSKRETICTGIRFACALAFNRQGDLFVTDQEGATWLPNGNPLDELLHIVPGRHYGFPPRHPKHLPQVIDEPAVMEYGPQHQSTVGMVFNESVNCGPSFGPTHWQGDAILCGESRGKIYRTKLVQTAEGYVAQNQLIACLGWLTVDACVSPRGDLLVACHSGPPDWGSGPAGDGKLFKIRYTRPDVPQMVCAWAAAPDEFRIAFDRTLKPEEWAGAKSKTRIEAGRYVSAGDRYEVIRPGYQVVRDQMASPRRWVDVQSVSLSADARTLVLRVPRQTEAVNYAVTLPVPPSWRTQDGIEQRPELDVALSLNGIQATLQSGAQSSRVILPHPSVAVARELAGGSAEHASFFQRLEKAGTNAQLTLRGAIDVANIFVPATQPGSVLDWDIAADVFANRTMAVRQDVCATSPREITLTTAAKGRVRPLQLVFNGKLNPSGSGLGFALDDQSRPVPLNRLWVPWTTSADVPASPNAPMARTDVKGRWLHGRRLFFGAAACGTCHTLRGEGIAFGPDLSNLVFRDRDSVIQDIVNPSATLNPDHTGSTVLFKDGAEVSGIIRGLTDERIVIRQPAGVETERPRKEVATIEPMKLSLMPEGLVQLLAPEQMEDLLTFLLTNPLEPAPITRLDPPIPPPRTRADIAAFLPSPGATPDQPAPLRVLLSAGQKDHGVDEHDYPVWLDRWTRLLALADNVSVASCLGFPTRDQLAAADVTVFNSANTGWDLKAAGLLDEYQQRGGGLVYLHWGIEGGKEAEALAECIGLAFNASAFRHGEMELDFTGATHPITQGFSRLRLTDESYWALRGDPARVSVLATAMEDRQPRPQLWTLQRHKGRVFGSIPGHYTWTFDDPLYRVLVLRGLAWAAGQADVNRLVELAPVGARLAP
ncbi:MAG TPA: ThuA domain-containing protein, partial [Verrucomicrobiae bacterium]